VLWFFHVQAIDLNSKKARNLGEKNKARCDLVLIFSLNYTAMQSV
jgi:hypothetical protein